MTVFVDTSAWYAAADAGDVHHTRAITRLEEFAGDLLTSDHVLVEAWFLASRRLGWDIAETLMNEIRQGLAQIKPVTLTDLDAAARIRESFPDQMFSIVDRTSWSVMQRLGLHKAIAFDRDYSIYRFGRSCRQAFTVYT